jgi:sarcosine oxidase, subunit beta
LSQLEVDVAIVGGGLIGCATAYYLRKRSRSVALLERGFVGAGSSGVNFGNLRLQGHHVSELPLALRSQGIWEGLEAELGERVEFAQHGHAHVAIKAEHLETIRRFAAAAEPFGLKVELLDRRETLRRWPFLTCEVLAASWSWRDAVANPRLVTPAFARAALALGATIRENNEVAGIDHTAGKFILRCADGSMVRSPCMVNAAGVWGGAIAKQFGEPVPVFPAGPVEIVTEPAPLFVSPVIHAVDGSILFRQTNRGNVLFAGHPRIPVNANSRITRVPPGKMATNMARLVALVPGLRHLHVIRTWTGIEGYLPDMTPILGPSGTTPGLFHGFACSGHGLQVGPAIATVLTELIVDGDTDTPTDGLGIGRFRNFQPVGSESLREEFQDGVLANSRAA